MKKAMTISYEVGSNLYLNLTNKCPCACTFCIRTHADGAYGSDPLWLEHEPSLNEIFDDLAKRDLAKYDEIVFCGYGEPTERLDVVVTVAKALRMLPNCPKLRINTNGLGERINGTSGTTAKILSETMDTVSVSLNAPTEKEYMEVTRPKYDNAFGLMCTFVRDCAEIGKAEVVVSIVDVIPQEQIDASRELAEKLGATLRIRSFDD